MWECRVGERAGVPRLQRGISVDMHTSGNGPLRTVLSVRTSNTVTGRCVSSQSRNVSASISFVMTPSNATHWTHKPIACGRISTPSSGPAAYQRLRATNMCVSLRSRVSRHHECFLHASR
jgi:hypothetical protein